ncbi:MAG: hypothetical protein M1832_001707 [Thelocarpon impressellum]|nr:MAG: hypothetical protein M1832_001707 [Thelocarpon impressellum]
MQMATLSVAVRANFALLLPSLALAYWINSREGAPAIAVKFEDVDTLPQSKAVVAFTGGTGKAVHDDAVITAVVRAFWTIPMDKQDHLEEWIGRVFRNGRSNLVAQEFKLLDRAMGELDAHLVLRSCIVGYSLTVIDLVVWGALRGNKLASTALAGRKDNVKRWFDFVETTNPFLQAVVADLGAVAKQKRAIASAAGASYEIRLENTENGVVTRFPPEPSGYLHIGHAKAAWLNDYFAHTKYEGTLILRFDDTNPSRETGVFQDAIAEDLTSMKIFPDKVTHSSDYFPELRDLCLKLLKNGDAYADDTEAEQMNDERWHGIESRHRQATVEDNLLHFSEMADASEAGRKWCIRAKISIDNPNKAMRDPVIYRCNVKPHHRTGETWKVYPTYDFCAPVLDSLEGVTHALRTNEYRDRNPQYLWVQRALGLREVTVWDFARMNFTRTLLSKRKLTRLVDAGSVWGWDDPRMPTIRGIIRRGMTMPALRKFIFKQGPSRNVVTMDWTSIWATNKKAIDPLVPRYTAVATRNAVEATIQGPRAPAAPYAAEKPKHGKNAGLGMKRVVFASTILIDQDDARTFEEGEEITLMNWGNAFASKSTSSDGVVTGLEITLHLEGDVKKTEKKITWLAKDGQELTPVVLVDFDHLITKDKLEKTDELEDFLTPTTEIRVEALADCNVADIPANSIVQLERRGYYRVDRQRSGDQPAILFCIPTGKK